MGPPVYAPSELDLAADYRGVTCDEIPWSLPAVTPLESVDLLTLDDNELLAYAQSLQRETRILRALLKESLAVIRRLTVQAERLSLRLSQFLKRSHS